eukprot:TRINITY_DN5092_c0_g1_i1.p1 TRINITY_DN5092_c0_g1~~TRINITY_DN5092_c0_g1_i1.p1  ORF type:complete len:335 (+),score=65.26 TRINITY_DN5092_c0_g1_i1:77-1006(+)
MAPKRDSKKSAPKKSYDYSGLETGMKCQAESDGTWYAAEIMAVSTSKNRSKAPVKVSYRGYEGYDEWVGGERLKSKALKVTTEKPEPKTRPPLEKPVLYYFPFAGRGELTRLIAAAGALEMEAGKMPEDRKDLCAECGALGTGVPVLTHGKLKMCQSQAIQNYVSLIAPKFRHMPAKARGTDMMWCAHIEDLILDVFKSGIGALLFQGDATNFKKDELKATLEKYFGVFEKLAPEEGFVTGGKAPTAADCCVVMLYKACAPYTHIYKNADFDNDKYPKLKALAERAAGAKGLKEYCESSESLKADPFKK